MVAIQFFVRDAKTQKALSGVRIIVLADYVSNVTSSDGRCVVITQFQGVLNYIAEKLGYNPVQSIVDTSIDVEWQIMLTPEETPSQPPQPPDVQKPGEEKIGRIGSSCALMVEHKYTHDVYFYKEDQSGKEGVHRRSRGDAVRDGNANPGCFLQAPAAPDSAIEQEKRERKEEDNILSEKIDSIKRVVDTFEKSIIGIVIEAFIYILEEVLNQEKKS